MTAFAADWTQFRGPNTDGSSSELIATTWKTNSPGFVVWTNSTLTNGFSCFAVSGGRAFTQISRNKGAGMTEYCVALDANTGLELWSTPLGPADRWDPDYEHDAGGGTAPYHKGDGPRTTPSLKDGRVFCLSGYLRLVCMNATNGSVVWSNNLVTAYGASTLSWENGASPCMDGDLIFVSMNTSRDGKNLGAFRTSDGQPQWRTRTEKATHATPIVTTIDGVRQVIFVTSTKLISLNTLSGEFLWEYPYPWASISVSMAASPVVYSNLVYCTASYNRGMACARVTRSGAQWSAQQLYYYNGTAYESVWMTPIAYEGHIYTLSGTSGTFLNQPLYCYSMEHGTLRWQTNGFGKGGLILVGTNILALTERGELRLFAPSLWTYREHARYKAMHFTTSSPGKCWNNATFADGRIYARGTRGAVCIDVSVPAPPALKLLQPRIVSNGQVRLPVGTVDGSPISADRVPGIRLRSSTDLNASPESWTQLTNYLVLGADGIVEITTDIDPQQPRHFYRASE